MAAGWGWEAARVAVGWGCIARENMHLRMSRQHEQVAPAQHMPLHCCVDEQPDMAIAGNTARRSTAQHIASTWVVARVAVGWGWEAARVAAGWGCIATENMHLRMSRQPGMCACVLL